jgi:seryl-tRNA synthetase
MSEILDKKDFHEIESVVSKKLRNKKKKMEKIISTENKIVAKEIKPTEEQIEMVESKDKVQEQIQELEDMKKLLKTECNKVLTKHTKIVKELKDGETNQANTIERTLGTIADALLINLLQNEYNVSDLLGQEERVGLEALMLPVKSLFNPPADQLSYSRARE